MWKLLKNWREVLIKSDFEVNQKLKHLLETTTGSILVSGDRGVGKTHIIQTISREKSDSMIFIWLNTIKINAVSEKGTNLPDQVESLNILFILKFLIEELSSLGLPEQKILKSIKKDLYITEKAITSDSKLSVNNSGAEVGYRQSVNEKWQGYTTAQLSSTLANYLVDVKGHIGMTGFEKIMHAFGSVGIGIGNAFQKFFNKRTERIVFVFDELDDIGDINLLLDLIKKFKNLFMRSGISFLFITSSNVYETVTNLESAFTSGQEDKYRTIFSDIVYIRRYTISTLTKHISNLTLVKSDNFDALSTYLAIEAKGNIYNLRRTIAAREVFDGDEIVLRHSDIDKKSVSVVNYAFRIGELLIEKCGFEQYIEDLLYMTLYEYTSDLLLYLSGTRQESRKTRFELYQKNTSYTKSKKNLIEKFINEFFETLSVIITSQPNGINFGEESQTISWEDVKEKIDSNIDVLDLLWSITPSHRRFYEKYLSVTEMVKIVFKQDDILKSSQLREHEMINDETSLEIKNALEQATLTVRKGSSSVTERGTAILTDIENKINKYWDFSKGILLRKDTDGIEYNRTEHTVKFNQQNAITSSPTTRLYTHLLEGSYKSKFDIEYTVKTSYNKSTVDVLLYFAEQYTGTASDAYYIVRITAQDPPSEFNRAGILLKDSNIEYDKAWYLINQPVKVKAIGLNEPYTIRIKLDKGIITLYLKKQSKEKYTSTDTVESYQVNQESSFSHIITTSQGHPIEILNIIKKE